MLSSLLWNLSTSSMSGETSSKHFHAASYLNSALHRLASIMRKQRRCYKVGKGFDGMHQRLERQLVHFTVSLPIENSSFLNSVTRLWMREVPALMEVRIERSHVNSHWSTRSPSADFLNGLHRIIIFDKATHFTTSTTTDGVDLPFDDRSPTFESQRT